MWNLSSTHAPNESNEILVKQLLPLLGFMESIKVVR